MKLDLNENFEEEDFFYMKKYTDGTYRYHLFPELNLKLIENNNFMIEFDRWEYKKDYEGKINDYNR